MVAGSYKPVDCFALDNSTCFAVAAVVVGAAAASAVVDVDVAAAVAADRPLGSSTMAMASLTWERRAVGAWAPT